MKYGLINTDYSDKNKEYISYFLFLEGKTINEISSTLGTDKSVIENQIIKGKIKYRYLSKSKNIKELLTFLLHAGKEDKLETINNFDSYIKKEFILYVNNNMDCLDYSYKQLIIWMIGELKITGFNEMFYKYSKSSYVGIRRMIASAIGKIGDKMGEDILINLLQDENPQVKLYAIKALTKINSIKANSYMMEIKDKIQKKYIIKAIEDHFNSTKEE